MYQVQAAEVSKLRNLTGAGMMDCKKALVEAEGDFDKSVEILRKKGQKVAANRADRDSTEGAVLAQVNEAKNKGVVLVLNCETDFVAKNEDFVKMATELAQMALQYSTKEELMAADFNGISVENKLIEQTGVIGEKIEIGFFQTLEAPFVGGYIHAGNRIASLVGFTATAEGAENAAKDVAMQVAAMNPVALDETKVSQDIIEKELQIAKDMLRQEGKPEAMLENIAQGKLKKFFKDNTLVHQDFIKDNKQSVQDYVKSIKADLAVTGFVRFGL